MLNKVSSISRVSLREEQEVEVSSFTQSVLNVLDRVEYRYCDSGEDLEAIYRLRYESYLKAGLLKPNAARAVIDSFDDLPNSYRYGVFYDGRLVSTIRLHAVDAAHSLAPSTELFGDVLLPRIAAGDSFVDPSRFAADPEAAHALKVLPYVTLRLALIACRYFKPTACLTTVREEHVAFYRRVFDAQPVVEGRSYPGLTVAGHLYQAVTPHACDYAERRFAFFKSTAFEQRLLFQRPKRGELAPLSVLPTAKYSLAAA